MGLSDILLEDQVAFVTGGGAGIGAGIALSRARFGSSVVLADESASDAIRVNNVAPGLIRSHSSRYLWQDESTLAKVSTDIPLQRIGEPEDIAGAVVFLSSTARSYLTAERCVGNARLEMLDHVIGLNEQHRPCLLRDSPACSSRV